MQPHSLLQARKKVDFLFASYIAAAIFGVGITIVDMFGIFGHHGQASDHSDGRAGDHAGADHSDAGGHHGEADHSGGVFDTSISSTGDSVYDSGHGETHAGHVQGDPIHSGHDYASHEHGTTEQVTEKGDRAALPPTDTKQQGSLLIRALGIIRNVVYFCFGFGPIAWLARVLGQGEPASLLFGLGAGVLFAAGGVAVRKLQRNVLDSQIQEAELYMEPATVIVPIEPGRLGKVRIDIAGVNVDRFAVASDTKASYPVGARVRIVEVDEDRVTVSSDS